MENSDKEKITDSSPEEGLADGQTPLPEYALTLDNVSFAYEEGAPKALNNVSLKVKRGEFLAVLGHNGSGKSTLAKLICGLLTADSGKITVWGFDPADKDGLNQVRTHAGVVFQNPDNQTVASIVEDDVAFGPENLGVPREEIAARIDWALSAVGMEKFRHATPTRLSGGQKQRIAVAGVLAVKPDVLILDESTAMLDPKGRAEICEVAARLNREEGMTVILITHFMEEALLATRAVVMNRGEIVSDGAPDEIFRHGDELETFNLCLPEILSICRYIKGEGIEIAECLRAEEIAKEIKQVAARNGFTPRSTGNTAGATENSGGEWDINISHLNYTYSAKSPFASHALKGVSLTIPEGEFFGVIGHTGSGKSTLIQHLNALIKLPQATKKYKKPKVKKGELPPTEPEITIGKYKLSDKKCDWLSLRSDVGMVFQYPEYQLFAETVFDDVAFGLKNFKKGVTEEECERAVRESLEAVGLNYEEVKDKSPFELSGGQKRRVAIAGVIVTKPKILILDEPAAGLDPLGKKEIMALLHKLHSEWCKTVIIVSHDMDEIAENCTLCAVLSEGELFDCATPSKLFKRYEELKALGLDVPLTAKICQLLSAEGLNIECDYTSLGFSKAVVASLKGGEVNA
ncbi:MAG: energy-coupling factor transporter ATPase [Candidatus Coproplasma sp.]